MNYTIPPINYTIIYHPETLSQLTGKNDVQVIGNYCHLFQTVSKYWIIAALLFLIIEQAIVKRLANTHPRIARWTSITSFALHAGFLLFLLAIILQG